MKCLLFASWKPYTTNALGYTRHQIIGRHRVVVRAHLFSFTSRSSRVIIGHLEMQSGNAQIESCQSGLDDSLSGYACRPLHIMRSARCAFRLAEMSAISWTMWNWSAHFRSRFKCWVLRLLANACMSVSHKCWHARLPASQRAAWFPSGLLSSIHKLCDTNSSDLSVWSSFAPFCICTAVPNALPVLAFSNSKRSHCKWIPNDSKHFQTITSLIWKDAFSANISLLSFHKNWSLIGRKKLHCWYWHNRAMAMSVKSCIEVHWLHLVSGQGSSSASSKTCSSGVSGRCLETCHCQSLKDGTEERGKSHAAVVAGNVEWIAFEATGLSTVLSWRNLRAFACGNSKTNPDF